jgi:hypothetical protein
VNIKLHIERLILEGLAIVPGQYAEIQTAVEAELTRLLAAKGVRADLQSGGAIPSLRGGAINVSNESNPMHLGNQIAKSVHGGIGPETTDPGIGGSRRR